MGSEMCIRDSINTGDIEILVSELTILNESKVPPFTIEENTDGGEELRMQYRYLDIRRNSLKNNLVLRHKVTQEVRNYLSSRDFIEVETPYLIKSTPEGARDFVVPSRMNEGEFYALPQSPQTFKQLLMVGGLDKYFQIVKCFRDEDLRADRQPEFTQIDCEMSFVNQEDILNTFEGLTKHLIKSVKNIDILNFPRMTYDEAMEKYGCDKPDIRFGMEFGNLNSVTKHTDFSVFNNAEEIIGIAVPGGSSFTRKEIDATFATYTVLDFENIIIDIATKILSSDKVEEMIYGEGEEATKKDVFVARFVCPENNYQELFDAYTKNLISNSTIEELRGMTESGINNNTQKQGGRRRRGTRKIMGGEVTEEQVQNILTGNNWSKIEKLIKDNILSGKFIRQFLKDSGVQKIFKYSMKNAVIEMHKDTTPPPEVTRNPIHGNVDPASDRSTELAANAMGKLDMPTVKNIINSEIGENPLIIQMIYDALGNVLCKNDDLKKNMIKIAETKFDSKIQKDKTIHAGLNEE